jgi:hypothetical protein
MTNEQFGQFILLMRSAGASIRTIAKFCGCSKSTMHRLLPKIEQLSQMGQLGSGSAAETGLSGDDLSQMGQPPVMDNANTTNEIKLPPPTDARRP